MSESRVFHSEALPNFDKAIIPKDKLIKYALNPSHPEGKHKARVFKSALGFDLSNWELLEQNIKEQLPFYPATKVAENVENQHGERYNVFLDVTGPNGNVATILTAWIIKKGTDYPSLCTTYLKNRA